MRIFYRDIYSVETTKVPLGLFLNPSIYAANPSQTSPSPNGNPLSLFLNPFISPTDSS